MNSAGLNALPFLPARMVYLLYLHLYLYFTPHYFFKSLCEVII